MCGLGYNHSADVFGELVLFVDIGFSPYPRKAMALLTLAAHLLLMAHALIMAKASGALAMSHLGAGPTGLRVELIGLTVGFWATGSRAGHFAGFSQFDIIFGAAGVVMVAVVVVQTLIEARRLAHADSVTRRHDPHDTR